MKIAVTGKGGVGKTTIAATLARLYAEEGHPVLAADVDPDANLGLALGFPWTISFPAMLPVFVTSTETVMVSFSVGFVLEICRLLYAKVV